MIITLSEDHTEKIIRLFRDAKYVGREGVALLIHEAMLHLILYESTCCTRTSLGSLPTHELGLGEQK